MNIGKANFTHPNYARPDWFDYYTTRFDSTEINTSFYHLPKEQTVINWAATPRQALLSALNLAATLLT